MSWIRFHRGRLAYNRRLDLPKSFDGWASGPGKPLVDAMAARRRFALFGRERAAKRKLWALLREEAAGPASEVIAAAVDAYLPVIAEIATVPVDLPRIVVSLRRLIVVPRVVANATARDFITFAAERLDLSGVERADLLREYFSTELLAALDEALLFETRTMRRPVQADRWLIVEADSEFSWWVPLSGDVGRDWRGHYIIYEAPPGKLTRSARRDLARQIEALQRQIAKLSRQQRSEIVSQTRMHMREFTARAIRDDEAAIAG